MSAGISVDRNANLAGSLWMIGSMAAFAVEDAFVKAATLSLPVGQVLILLGLGGAIVFAALARMRNERLFVRDVLSPPMRIRFGFEVTGRLFYVLAISLIPLSAATVILQATPIVVVMGAALVFGEKVGWRRWTAILVGLAGVLIILRPGAESFSLLSILAVIGMIGFAGRDLASRAAPAALGTLILGFYGFIAIITAGVVFSLWQGVPFVWPSMGALAILLAAVSAGVLGYSCLMKAMRTGEVSAVTPFRYSRLLFGIALGMVMFGEQPDLAMLAGSALIVASGIFIRWRGNQLGQPQPKVADAAE